MFWLWAEKPGSGKLLPLLRAIEEGTGKYVVIAQPLMKRLVDFCIRNDFRICSTVPEVSMRFPQRPEKLMPFNYIPMMPNGLEAPVRLFLHKVMTAPPAPDGEGYWMMFSKAEQAKMMAIMPYMQQFDYYRLKQ